MAPPRWHTKHLKYYACHNFNEQKSNVLFCLVNVIKQENPDLREVKYL